MTDSINPLDTNEENIQEDELAMLKKRAKVMGVQFSNNVGLDTLRQRIEDHLENEANASKASTAAAPNPLDEGQVPAVQVMTLRQYMQKEQMRLVRVRITNLDPKKKDLPGEIFTVANEYLGTVRKYVPFGEVTEDGYHVPYCIYTMMEARQFLNIRTYKDRKNNGQIVVEQSWSREFALEILDPLTPQELAALATTQAAAGGLS